MNTPQRLLPRRLLRAFAFLAFRFILRSRRFDSGNVHGGKSPHAG
jgi:hypothetical protein